MADVNSILNKTQQAGKEQQQNSYQFPSGTYLRQFQDATTKADKWNAGIGAGIAGLNGLMSIGTNAMNATQIQETPEFDQQLSEIDAIGRGDYNSYDQVLNGYQNLGYAPQQNFDSVRGMDTGQKIANAGSSILQGATTGLSIAGPWGALGGAVVGGLTSLFGILQGDENARFKVMEDNMNSQIAQNNANLNLMSNINQIRDRDFRNKFANRSEMGGKVERKQMDIKEFADSVLGTRSTSRIVRKKCNGGVMIKVKA